MQRVGDQRNKDQRRQHIDGLPDPFLPFHVWAGYIHSNSLQKKYRN
jgi:hypothetical protein